VRKTTCIVCVTGDSNDACGRLVDELTKASLAIDESVQIHHPLATREKLRDTKSQLYDYARNLPPFPMFSSDVTILAFGARETAPYFLHAAELWLHARTDGTHAVKKSRHTKPTEDVGE